MFSFLELNFESIFFHIFSFFIFHFPFLNEIFQKKKKNFSQINDTKTILRRSKNDPDVITEEHLMNKVNEMASFQELMKTNNIKKKTFRNASDQITSLTIFIHKKKKDKKMKRKNDPNKEVDSEAVQ